MNSHNVIFCQELIKNFGAFRAVDQISFYVKQGTICAFLGPNGAGKSTTVKMLTGQIQPTSGIVKILGCDFGKDGNSIRSRMGVLPENLGLFDDLTIEEHLLLTGDIYGLSRSVTRERTEELLDLLDLSEDRHRFARQCSHGMRKKTSFAMAVIHNPPVLFLDEPFEAVDPVAAQSMQSILRQAAQRGTTIFLTSHILSMIQQLADQVMMIRSGKIVWNSRLSEVSESLDELFFRLQESPKPKDMEWLGSDPFSER